jgi:GntR family transcriptional regulator
MTFQINFKSGKPAYLQLVDQVKAAVASGNLRAGDTLAGIRPLAEELRLNRNTVAKAYGELETQGVIQTTPGKGCFIAANNSPLKKEVRLKMLSDEIDAVIVQAHHLQIADEPFVELVRKRLNHFQQENAKHASL